MYRSQFSSARISEHRSRVLCRSLLIRRYRSAVFRVSDNNSRDRLISRSAFAIGVRFFPRVRTMSVCARTKRAYMRLIRKLYVIHVPKQYTLATVYTLTILDGVKHIQWRRYHRGEECGLFTGKVRCGFIEIATRRGFSTVNTISPFDHIQIKLEDAFFRKVSFEKIGIDRFPGLSKEV